MDNRRAWNYTLWLLGRRAYTEGELRERLRRKEADPDVITHTVKRLKELRLIDDEAFTAGFIRSRSSRHGRLRLQQDLRQRGVAAEVITGGLEQLDDEGQAAAALEILRKIAWRFEKDDDDYKKRTRAFAFLVRRGFTVDAARQAVQDFLAGLSDNSMTDGSGDT